MLAIEAWMQTDEYKKNGPVYILGHGLGGYFAAHYATRYPSNIKGLILM